MSNRRSHFTLLVDHLRARRRGAHAGDPGLADPQEADARPRPPGRPRARAAREPAAWPQADERGAQHRARRDQQALQRARCVGARHPHAAPGSDRRPARRRPQRERRRRPLRAAGRPAALRLRAGGDRSVEEPQRTADADGDALRAAEEARRVGERLQRRRLLPLPHEDRHDEDPWEENTGQGRQGRQAHDDDALARARAGAAAARARRRPQEPTARLPRATRSSPRRRGRRPFTIPRRAGTSSSCRRRSPASS